MSSRALCTCHQASGDSWDCPMHYDINPRFRDAKRLLELSGRRPTIGDQGIRLLLRKIDAENAGRQREFYRKLNEVGR